MISGYVYYKSLISISLIMLPQKYVGRSRTVLQDQCPCWSLKNFKLNSVRMYCVDHTTKLQHCGDHRSVHRYGSWKQNLMMGIEATHFLVCATWQNCLPSHFAINGNWSTSRESRPMRTNAIYSFKVFAFFGISLPKVVTKCAQPRSVTALHHLALNYISSLCHFSVSALKQTRIGEPPY